jgi:hypothetical protein
MALLENRQKSNSWSYLHNILETGIASIEDPLLVWGTILGVVYGIVDDRLAFLKALIRPGAPDSYYRLALHALLSNPRKPADHEQILFPFFQDLPIADSTRLNRLLESSRPELAERLARRLLDHRQGTNRQKKAAAPISPANQLVDLLIEAELHQLARQGEESILLRSKALSLARDLQADLARHLIQKNLTEGELSNVHSKWNQVLWTSPCPALIANHRQYLSQEVRIFTQPTDEDHPFAGWLLPTGRTTWRSFERPPGCRRCLSLTTIRSCQQPDPI